MSVYDILGNIVKPYDFNGNLCKAYDINGNILSGDYNEYSSEYERNILVARDSWIEEAREDSTVIPMIIHTDQHDKLIASNTLFPYLAKAISWSEMSACIGLGDVNNYSVSAFQNMESCLSGIPKEKQINIWGNHDTWFGTVNDNILTEEHLTVLNTYFDNSSFNGNHKYNDYGIEYMIDEEKKVKYVVIGGWEYDHDLGGYSHYNIGYDSMNYIVQMLSQVDEYDIVILSHVQPFKNQTSSSWTCPPVEAITEGSVGVVVNASETYLDQMLIDRQNKVSGTVYDSYGNAHEYDFTNCTSNILCCFSGHEHRDSYMYQNGNIPIYIFDAYAYDNQPFYFVNINRTKGNMNIWKVDNSPMIYNYQISLSQTS